MNPKKNLILLLVLIISGGGLYLYDIKWAAEKKTEEERVAKILKGIDKEKITRISVERKKEPYQLIRTERGWRFVKPIDAPVDSDVAEALLQAAGALKEERENGEGESQDPASEDASQIVDEIRASLGGTDLTIFGTLAEKNPKWTGTSIPGSLLTALLLSLGAPFWYGLVGKIVGFRAAAGGQAKKAESQT